MSQSWLITKKLRIWKQELKYGFFRSAWEPREVAVVSRQTRLCHLKKNLLILRIPQMLYINILSNLYRSTDLLNSFSFGTSFGILRSKSSPTWPWWWVLRCRRLCQSWAQPVGDLLRRPQIPRPRQKAKTIWFVHSVPHAWYVRQSAPKIVCHRIANSHLEWNMTVMT